MAVNCKQSSGDIYVYWMPVTVGTVYATALKLWLELGWEDSGAQFVGNLTSC